MSLGAEAHNDLVVVANRLPFRRADDGGWTTSPGGLVAALAPALAQAPAPLKIGFIYVGPKDDFGYNQAHAEAVADSLARVGYDCTVATSGAEDDGQIKRKGFARLVFIGEMKLNLSAEDDAWLFPAGSAELDAVSERFEGIGCLPSGMRPCCIEQNVIAIECVCRSAIKPARRAFRQFDGFVVLIEKGNGEF